MTSTKNPGLQADLWSKTLAGVVLGWTLALALVGLFAWLGPGGIKAPDKVQFNMWLIAPVWMLILAPVYLFPSGRQAWGVLLGLNILAHAALLAARSVLHP